MKRINKARLKTVSVYQYRSFEAMEPLSLVRELHGDEQASGDAVVPRGRDALAHVLRVEGRPQWRMRRRFVAMVMEMHLLMKG